ncbi:ATP-binding protein [Pontibacter sp. BT731]|uniref:sensor histidine kinase n=1 Tax=Pontibacter coccineus TaxID=3063328 RepID=UPI0026E330B3|nr:ATP-binding protein [Pontibacter sp. BT731]MDO6388874.1 ATP-binding protein [Pontibacter sp. BT731]
MKLRTKFIIFAVFLHGLLAAMAYFLLQENKLLFIGMEVLVLLSVAVTVNLYNAFFKPLNLIRAGIESIRDKDFSTKFVQVGQPELDELVDVYNRMIEQLRQERVAQAEKHFLLEKIIQASPAGIILLDFDNRIESINPAAERFLYLSGQSLQGSELAALPNTWARELTQVQAGQPYTFRLNGIRTFRAHRAHFIDRGFQRAFIMLEELTEAIIKNERQAYEKVIRMMSHEVNNSTGAINSILDSVQYYTPQINEEHREDFTYALQVAIDRNTNLSKFMANFADVVRLPAPSKKPVQVQALLKRLERLMLPQLEKRQINLSLQLPATPLCISMDEQQIEQALLNILKNAMEAVKSDGSIWVELQEQPPYLTITDNGEGIPEHVRPMLFTPFFSTKETGQGIGLTMIREILLSHGFQFSLESDADGLTSFRIRLSAEDAK